MAFDVDLTNLDDANVYTILEGYSGGDLISSSISYDFTYKWSDNVMEISDLDDNYRCKLDNAKTKINDKDPAGYFCQLTFVDTLNPKTDSFYDWFILEFPPAFGWQ